MGDNFTLLLIVTIAISVIGGSFQYGYNISVVNAPAKIIQAYFFEGEPCGVNETIYGPGYQNATTAATTTNANSSAIALTAPVQATTCELVLTGSELLVWSVTVSIYTVGGMIGSFVVGTLVGRFGRKYSLLVMNILSISGAIMMACSKVGNSIALLIIPRFLLGIYSGLATGIVPMYIGEISPKKYRGAVVALNQLLVTIGLLTAQVLGLTEIMGTESLWPFLLALTCVPSILELLVLPWCPESPRCLLIDRNKEDSARKALVRFRGTHDVEDEMEEMRIEARAESSTSQLSVFDIFRDRSLRWQVISICVVHIGQPLTGINAVFFYLNAILEGAKIDEEIRNYISVGIGTWNVFLTIITVLVIEKVGRRPLLFGGYVVTTLSLALMTISLSLPNPIPNLSIASVFLFILGFAVGPGPIPWLLSAELFRQSARPASTTLGCGLNWTFNILVALIFPFMQKYMKQYVFTVFLASSAVVTVYVWIVLPETKNKTFQEISMMFAKRNGVKQSEIEKENAEMERLG